jgi:hypothetical protein
MQYTIPQEDFDKLLVRFSRLSTKVRNAARMHLVFGYSQAEAARVCNVGRVMLNKRVVAMRRYYESMQNCPPGWVTITLSLPKELLPNLGELQKEINAARDRISKESLLKVILSDRKDLTT